MSIFVKYYIYVVLCWNNSILFSFYFQYSIRCILKMGFFKMHFKDGYREVAMHFEDRSHEVAKGVF